MFAVSSTLFLPSYAAEAAMIMAQCDTPRPRQPRRKYDKRVSQYLDLEANVGVPSEGSSDEII